MTGATDAARAMRRSMGVAETPAPRLAEGTLVAGRYRVLDVIGEGGMGTVYRAQHLALHRHVALKVVRPELSADPQMVARFEREAFASSRISSPHVVVVHDFGRDDTGLLYLIMELLEGESLAERLDRTGALPIGEALRVSRDVARALEVAHLAGIVHRDLKPDNVFITSGGDVKVLDFGIARILEGPAGAPVGSNATMTGMIVGTPVYMSPEAISRQPVGPGTDLYALGVMLFELLTGEPPFMASEAVLLMGQHLTAQPPRLESVAPSFARKPELGALVGRLLEKSSDQRGDTRRALTELTELAARYADDRMIGSAATQRLVSPHADTVSASHRVPRGRGVAVGVVAALAVLAALGSAGAWVLASMEPEPASASAPEAVTETEPEEAVPEPVAAPEAVIETEPEAVPEPVADLAPEPAPVADPAPEPAPVADPEADPEERPRRRDRSRATTSEPSSVGATPDDRAGGLRRQF